MADDVDMDAAAARAEKDFKVVFTEEQQKAFAAWWNAHYLAAGHKRLGRIMVNIHKGTANANKP
jgi:hypothetical protein